MPDKRVDQMTTVNPSLTDLIMLIQNGEAVNTTFARIRNLIVGSGSLETAATDIIAALNEINTNASNNATAITNLKNKIGIGDFATTSQNAVGAVKELKDHITGNETEIDNLAASVAKNAEDIESNTASLTDMVKDIKANADEITSLNTGDFKFVERSTALMGEQEIVFNNKIKTLVINAYVGLTGLRSLGFCTKGSNTCVYNINELCTGDIQHSIILSQDIGNNRIQGKISFKDDKTIIVKWELVGSIPAEAQGKNISLFIVNV